METNFLDTGFVVWGCGARFRWVAETLLRFRVIAIVDNAPAFCGKQVYDLPIVDQEMYLTDFDAYPILITPMETESIVAFLKAHGITHYFFLDEIFAPTARPQRMEAMGNAAWRMEKLAAIVRLKDVQLANWSIWGVSYFSHHFLGGSEAGVGWKRPSIVQLLYEARHPAMKALSASTSAPIDVLLNVASSACGQTLSYATDVLIVHGLNIDFPTLKLAAQAERFGVPIVFSEDGFLRSIEPADGKSGLAYTRGHALMLDIGGLYIHADTPSMFENAMNSERELSTDERARARRLMGKIRKECLSKYNHQPRLRKRIGTPRRTHILVVDQVFSDKSISFGWATDDTFREMLDAALRENPEAEIFIKAHPVKSQGHFADVEETDRIHLLTEPMNPIDLIDQMDKVYVCTSQLGFEAAFCGKEVHVFGMPFYAGWGFTIDAQKHPRRTKRRTVEEAFYFAYIACSIYVSYETQGVCEIEQAIDELITLRKTYQRRVLGGGTKKHLEWMLYRSAHLPSEGRAA